MKQRTLFDMAPQRVESPPLVTSPDEIIELRLTVHIDSRTRTYAHSIQVKSALTDELFSWNLKHHDGPIDLFGPELQSRLKQFASEVLYWSDPF